jgi:hypothetical protein
MAKRTITSANSVFVLIIPGLYDAPQQIQGFGPDDAFDTDAVEPAETMMGVDGFMSAGYVPVLTKQGVTLQADSLSNDVFDAWFSLSQANRETVFASGTILMRNIGRSFILVNGILSRIPRFATASKTLRARKFEITWEQVLAEPV